MGVDIRVDGLSELVRGLKGPAFRDINKELRGHARRIAADVLLPEVTRAVAAGAAPQAQAMAATVRVVSDRVPVVAVGRVNPRFSHPWTRKGENAAQRRIRRGSMARGVVVGPLGGHRDTDASENYYKTPRDASGGPLGAALREGGPVLQQGQEAYLKAYTRVLTAAGFDAEARRR